MAAVVGILAVWSVISLATALVLGCYARSLRVPIPADRPELSVVPDPIVPRLPALSRA
jgi:hypothetical protein